VLDQEQNWNRKHPKKSTQRNFPQKKAPTSFKTLELVRNWLSQIERPKRRTTKSVKKLLPEIIQALDFFVPKEAVPSSLKIHQNRTRNKCKPGGDP
jgi:hypothetical protein